MGKFLHASNPDLKSPCYRVQGDICGDIRSRHAPDAHAPAYIFVEYSNSGKDSYLGMKESTDFQKCISVVIN